MKQRENGIWKWLSNLWESFIKWITPIFCIGAIMVISSMALIASQNGILQAAGTAMLAAGLTIITTTLTGKESARQQFAKEANTFRKDTIYGPLFIELKQIYEWLDEAKRKEGWYPSPILGVSGEPDSAKHPYNEKYLTFRNWTQFRDDYRIDSFKISTRKLLNEAQELMVTYNRAMEATKDPTVNVLAPYIKKAVSAWMAHESFKKWDAIQDYKDEREVRTEDEERTEEQKQRDHLYKYHEWNSNLQWLSMNSLVDESTEMARSWLEPHAVGWLVAGARDKAALSIHNSYRTVRPDLSWFQGIINEAWSEIDILQEIKEARMVAEALHTKVEKAANLLETGIRFIRDQYEGGEPPV